jgi:hypothetical protein
MLNKFKGDAMKSDMKQDKAMVKKAVGMHDKQMHGGKKTDMDKLKKGGMSAAMKDKVGRAMPAPTADMMGRAMPRRPMAAEAAPPMMKKGGMTKMAKGGGIESKGKTQGKLVKMSRGGRSC